MKLDKRSAKIAHQNRQYFIVSEEWLRQWRKFVTDDGNPPGPIDNSVLLDGQHPKSDLEVSKDYRALPKAVWVRLNQIYGGGPVICRREVNIYSPKAR